uniref:Zinc finger MYND-type containing 12 n=1 Tax=Felis catus TaxID=9685 RepID=A0ABI8ABM7_FELCA
MQSPRKLVVSSASPRGSPPSDCLPLRNVDKSSGNLCWLVSISPYPKSILCSTVPWEADLCGLHDRTLLLFGFCWICRIYFASCAFGTEDIRTSGGYFHLANIFYGLKKLDVADTLYTKVSEIWSKYLNNRYQVLSEARIQQIDLLGKRFETDTGLDEAQEAEAIQILTSVWNIRESTSDTAPQKTIFVLNTLVMLYYLMMHSSKAQEYAERAFGLAKEHHLSVHEQSTIQELLSLISAEETHPVT